MNYAAVDKGVEGIVEVKVPAEWANAVDAEAPAAKDEPEYVKTIVTAVNTRKGDTLPVSAFKGIEDGTTPLGTAAYEKRGAAVNVPEWDPEKCIQCNQCSYVCPHATIRPFLLTAEEAANAPEGFKMADAKGGATFAGLKLAMQVSALDCLGCGSCVNVCPANEKAITMKPLATLEKEAAKWEYAMPR